MKIRALALLTVTILSATTIPSISSQTTRVRIATNPQGHGIYTDVFEYDYVDKKPEFPGGRNSLLKFINDNRQYPQEAYEIGIEGRVTCSFIVHPNGKVSHIQILRGVESSLNNEAIRVLSLMPDWSPGEIHEMAVPVRVVCCIPFRK